MTDASLQQAQELRDAVLRWLEERGWRGHDPFDGLTSPLARPFVDGPLRRAPGAKLVRLAVLQALKRSPLNLRPVLRVPPLENAMSWAVGALAALEALPRDPTQASVARDRIERMLALRSPSHPLWGYPFPWQARAFYVPANHPNLVISAVCLRALADGIAALPSEASRWRNEYARSLGALHAMFWRAEGGYFSYVDDDAVLVHNANLFGAEAVFAGAARGATNASQWLADAERAVRSTLEHQEASGRWSYGTRPHHAWADNFHTAYNLVSLARIHGICASLGLAGLPPALETSIRKGLDYYLAHAFTPEGSARYFDNETWPLEAHSAAAALIALKELADRGWLERAAARELTRRALDGARRDFYLGGGRFAYRRWRSGRVRNVFARWTQSWIYFGLACAAKLLGDEKENA